MENNNSKFLSLKSTYIGAFSVFAGALFFSGKAILVKMIYDEVPEVNHVTLLALRMGFSLPFFLAIVCYAPQKENATQSIAFKDWIAIIVLGVGGYYLSSVFDFWGLEYVSASLERLILFTYPTLVVVISLVLYRKKLTKVLVFSLLLAYVGITVVLWGEQLTSNGKPLLKGIILVFGASITYASYLVGSEKMIYKLGNIRYTSIVMSVACACVLIHFLLVNQWSDLSLPRLVLLKALYMAVFCTVIPAFLISSGIKMIGASNASIIASIGPVSTLFLASYFLNEQIAHIQMVGTLFVVAGVLLTSLYGEKS